VTAAIALTVALVVLRAGPYESELQFCVDQTNQYRATVGLPALKRSEALEAYAATSARVDAKSRVPHRYFEKTDGGGIAMAETLIPWWPLSRYGSIREIVRRGLAGMWAEGRGGGHYDIIVGKYAELGCGIYSDGKNVTVVQAFR
jgi:Cysteine-rich secretory protein family